MENRTPALFTCVPGAQVLYAGARCEIVRIPSMSVIVIRDVVSNDEHHVRLKEIHPANDSGPGETVPFEVRSQHLADAVERERELRPYLVNGLQLSAETRNELCEKLRIGKSRLYQLLKTLESDPRPAAIASRPRGPKPGKKKLAAAIEDLIALEAKKLAGRKGPNDYTDFYENGPKVLLFDPRELYSDRAADPRRQEASCSSGARSRMERGEPGRYGSIRSQLLHASDPFCTPFDLSAKRKDFVNERGGVSFNGTSVWKIHCLVAELSSGESFQILWVFDAPNGGVIHFNVGFVNHNALISILSRLICAYGKPNQLGVDETPFSPHDRMTRWIKRWALKNHISVRREAPDNERIQRFNSLFYHDVIGLLEIESIRELRGATKLWVSFYNKMM